MWGDIYVDVTSTAIRVAFRTAFFILSAWLGAAGSMCNQLNVKLRLLRDKRISVPEAAGWMQGTGVFDPLRNLRRIPRCKWWALMVAVMLLTKVNDLMISTIRGEYVPSLCEFGTGMVLSEDGSSEFNVPPFNEVPAFVAGSAQLLSVEHGCDQGIYVKVNSDARFCAASTDIIGFWDCQLVGDDITYKRGTTADDVLQDLVGRGLLYGSYASEYTHSGNSTTVWTHLVAWSSSEEDESDAVFDVKASIDTTPEQTDVIEMRNMHCTLQETGNNDQVCNIAKNIPSASTLDDWKEIFQGYMYDGYHSPKIDNAAAVLAWYLNTMIMVAGGSDTILTEAPADDPYQGCLLEPTLIPGAVVALLTVTTASCVTLSVLAIYLWTQTRFHSDRAQVKHAPIDRWTWMAQAVAESNADGNGAVQPVQLCDLPNWDLEREDKGSTVRVVQRGTETQSLATIEDDTASSSVS